VGPLPALEGVREGGEEGLTTARFVLPRATAGWLAALAIPVALAAAGDPPLAPEAGPPAVTLTRVGVLGELPRPPKPDERPAAEGDEATAPVEREIRVTLAQDGRLHVEVAAGAGRPATSRAVTYEGLRTFLRDETKVDPARSTWDGSSSRRLVLRLDRRASWGAAASLMELAADPKVKTWRLLFAVLPLEGDVEGVVAAYLPKDRGIQVACGVPDPTVETMPLHVVAASTGPGTPLDHTAAAVATVVDAAKPAGKRVLAQVDAGSSVPTGVVLETVDAAFRAGARGVVFHGVRSPKGEDADAAFVALARGAKDVPYRVRTRGADIAAPADPASVPRPAGRSTARLAGSFDVEFVSAGLEEVEEDVPAKDAAGAPPK
jgi:hypothetical protein